MDREKLKRKIEFIWTNLEIDLNEIDANGAEDKYIEAIKTLSNSQYIKGLDLIKKQTRRLKNAKDSETFKRKTLNSLETFLNMLEVDYKDRNSEIDDLETYCLADVPEEMASALRRFKRELFQIIDQLNINQRH